MLNTNTRTQISSTITNTNGVEVLNCNASLTESKNNINFSFNIMNEEELKLDKVYVQTNIDEFMVMVKTKMSELLYDFTI